MSSIAASMLYEVIGHIHPVNNSKYTNFLAQHIENMYLVLVVHYFFAAVLDGPILFVLYVF